MQHFQSTHMVIFDTPIKIYTAFDQCVAETTLAKALKSIVTPKAETRTSVDYIRKESDYDKRKALKLKSLAFPPSVYCGEHRKKEAIISYTGFAHIDLDAKDNKGITVGEMKHRLMPLDYIAFISLSTGGHGIFALARIDPTKWDQAIDAILFDLSDLGLKCDTQVIRNPVSLRFATYDPDAYINPNATQLITEYSTDIYIPKGEFERLEKRQKASKNIARNQSNINQYSISQYNGKNIKDVISTKMKVERALLEIECEGIDITDGYDNWLKIGFALADEFGEKGRGYFHTVSSLHPKYHSTETEKQYDNCLNHPYSGQKITIAYFFHLCKQYGIGTSTHIARSETSVAKKDYSKYEKYLSTASKSISDVPPATHSAPDTSFLFDDNTPIPNTIPDNLKEHYLHQSEGGQVLAQWLYEGDVATQPLPTESRETTEAIPKRKITFEETHNDNNAILEWFAQPNDDDDGEPFLPDEYRPKPYLKGKEQTTPNPSLKGGELQNEFPPFQGGIKGGERREHQKGGSPPDKGELEGERNVKALFENFGANATPYVPPVFYSEVKHSVYDGFRKRYAKGKEQKFINERLRKLQKEHRQTDKRGNILKYMNFLEMCECFGLRDAIKHVGFVVSLHQPERYPLYRTYLEAVNG